MKTNFNYKEIHIGNLIKKVIEVKQVEENRICNFMNCNEEEIENTYESKSLDCEKLLRWSKLLKYDFFRIYSQHLVFYAPVSSLKYKEIQSENATEIPQFKKNIYTKEIIDFVLDQIASKEKTPAEIINHYRIPKTTLYKWIKKYGK